MLNGTSRTKQRKRTGFLWISRDKLCKAFGALKQHQESAASLMEYSFKSSTIITELNIHTDMLYIHLR